MHRQLGHRVGINMAHVEQSHREIDRGVIDEILIARRLARRGRGPLQ